MEIYAEYNPISGASILYNTLFWNIPRFRRLLDRTPNHHPNPNYVLGDCIYGVGGLPIGFRKITPLYMLYRLVLRLSKVSEFRVGTMCNICTGNILGSG